MPRSVRRALLAAACAAVCLTPPARADDRPFPVPDAPAVEDAAALLLFEGTATVPAAAPRPVRRLIRAANRIAGLPYEWGGGHARLIDDGYDCSGAVSYALIKAGLLEGTRTSGSFRHWGARGRGEWLTVYARNGHVYLEVAGLRFEALPREAVGWRATRRAHRRFQARHFPGL
jgi:hypothetical protein